MDKMREGFQRRARRMQENIQQTVGLSERSNELQSVSHIDQRNQKMISMVKNTRQNLQSCLRSGNKEESLEKRKRRLEEFTLYQQLDSDAKDLDTAFPRSEPPPVLSEVFRLYRDAVGIILEERVLTDQTIEKKVIDALTKYVEEEKALAKARDKLSRIRTDLEVSRKRKLGNHDPSKEQEFQDDYDALQLKLDNYKDNIFTDIYTLASKEAEIASVFRDLIEAQIDFHQTAVQKLQNVLPEIDRKIASYPKRPVFGCHLEDHLRYSKRSIAVVLEVCCSALLQHGFNEKGLFRVNGNNNRIRRMKAAFDAHQMHPGTPEFDEYLAEPHSICSVLKSYLRELPEPLMTHELHSEWVHIARKEPEVRKLAIAELLPHLPEANRLNLAYLIRFLHLMLDYEDQTMMNAGNLSIVFGPNLIDGGTGSESENMLGSKLVETLLLNADFFFPNDKFVFSSPMTNSVYFPRPGNAAVEDDRASLRSAQMQVDVMQPGAYNNSAPGFSPQSRNAVSPQTPSLRVRPRCPAPPPPASVSNSHTYGSQVEEISSILEHLNLVVSKSPSVASNDSMADYGYSNVEIYDDFNNEMDMTREVARPTRPPPPRNAQRASSPERSSSFNQACARPVSYMNAVGSSQEGVVPPPRRSTTHVSPPVSVDESNRTVVHLESDSVQCSASPFISKPPLPAKPRAEPRLNEMTKL